MKKTHYTTIKKKQKTNKYLTRFEIKILLFQFFSYFLLLLNVCVSSFPFICNSKMLTNNYLEISK